MTVMNKGVLIETTTMVDSTDMRQMRNMPTCMGIMISITSMSLAKRLTIRPKGVVSKNCMGERMMLCKQSACRTLEAATAPNVRRMAPKNTKIPVTNQRAEHSL